MAIRTVFLLLAALLTSVAHAGERVALDAYGVSGTGVGRFELDGAARQQPVHIHLLFGPSHSCFAPALDADEFSLGLLAEGTIVSASGRWRSRSGGGAALAALEPRLVRSRLEIRPRERGRTLQARLRGRIELDLVDRETEEVAFQWAVSFRDDGALELYHPSVYGFCATVINLSY